MGAKPLKGVLDQILPSCVALYKIGIRHTKLIFTYILHSFRQPSEVGWNLLIFSVQVCAQMHFCVYSSYAHVKHVQIEDRDLNMNIRSCVI